MLEVIIIINYKIYLAFDKIYFNDSQCIFLLEVTFKLHDYVMITYFILQDEIVVVEKLARDYNDYKNSSLYSSDLVNANNFSATWVKIQFGNLVSK